MAGEIPAVELDPPWISLTPLRLDLTDEKALAVAMATSAALVNR